jgi:hypothetical protein
MTDAGPAEGIELVVLPEGACINLSLSSHGSAPEAPLAAAIDVRWKALCEANPRFHDGDVLSVLNWAGTTILCEKRSFRELAVRPQVDTGCELLAVSGMVITLDSSGTPRLLLGKRHPQTRIYGGLWELGPSGGVPPPVDGRLSEQSLLQQLDAEMREEAGLSLAGATTNPVAIVRDLVAFSLDIVYRVDMAQLPDPTRSERGWEYTQIRWLSPREARAWAEADPDVFIPPTYSLLRRMDEHGRLY